MNDLPESHEGDDDSHAHFYVFNPFGGMSREEFVAQLDQHHAQIDAAAHRGVGFFESLNEEQLLTMRGLLNAMAGQPESTLPYYMGVVTTHLQHRFKICPACSLKHDDELEKLVQTGRDEMSHGQADTDDEELEQLAKTWGVVFTDSGDGRPLNLTPVTCVNECGAGWTNLADRMLRPAGETGCPGCIYKAKNG